MRWTETDKHRAQPCTPNTLFICHCPCLTPIFSIILLFFPCPPQSLVFSDFALCQGNKGPTGPHFVPTLLLSNHPLGNLGLYLSSCGSAEGINSPQWPQDQEGIGTGLGPRPDLGRGADEPRAEGQLLDPGQEESVGLWGIGRAGCILWQAPSCHSTRGVSILGAENSYWLKTFILQGLT